MGRVDGEALVMHAGDKPYVVSPTGQVDLASRGLTLEAVNGIVSQLRAYTTAELRELCEGSAEMVWDVGQVPIAKGRGRLTYLIAFPP